MTRGPALKRRMDADKRQAGRVGHSFYARDRLEFQRTDFDCGTITGVTFCKRSFRDRVRGFAFESGGRERNANRPLPARVFGRWLQFAKEMITPRWDGALSVKGHARSVAGRAACILARPSPATSCEPNILSSSRKLLCEQSTPRYSLPSSIYEPASKIEFSAAERVGVLK